MSVERDGGSKWQDSRPSGARYVAQAGLIAAAYAAATLIVIQNPWGFGPVQFRISEALTVLALFTPAAVPGLALGCALANGAMVAHFGVVALLDVVFGSLATLVAAAWTYRMRRNVAVALLGPVFVNALVVAAYLPIVLAATGMYDVTVLGIDIGASWGWMYLYGAAGIALGEAAVVYLLGWPLVVLLRRLGLAGMVQR